MNYKKNRGGLVAKFNLGNGLDYLQTGLMVIFSMRRLTLQEGQCPQIKKGRLFKWYGLYLVQCAELFLTFKVRSSYWTIWPAWFQSVTYMLFRPNHLKQLGEMVTFKPWKFLYSFLFFPSNCIQGILISYFAHTYKKKIIFCALKKFIFWGN